MKIGKPSYRSILTLAAAFIFPLSIFTTSFVLNNIFLFIGSFVIYMFSITAGYHRYFSHRAYKAGRIYTFVIAFIACCTLQGGPLWWLSLHRNHHRHVDKPEDVHSPAQYGLWMAHIGWFLQPQNLLVNARYIIDWINYRDLMYLTRFAHFTPIIPIVLLYLVGGYNWVVYGYFLPVCLANHAAFCVNSLSHTYGKQRFHDHNQSRNNWFAALISLGEWHNNHHHYPPSAKFGIAWYELDLSFIILRIFEKLGLIKNLKQYPVDRM